MDKPPKDSIKFLDTLSKVIKEPNINSLYICKLLSDTRLNKKQRQFLQLLRECMTDGLNFLNNMIDYRFYVSGNVKTKETLCDLDMLLEKCNFTSLYKTVGRDIEIKWYISKDLKPYNIITDTEKLSQVLLNLFDNAIRHNVAIEKLVIETRVSLGTENSPQDCIRFEISDNGKGIDTKIHPNLFTEPVQSDSSLGIGLLLCKYIVNLLNGKPPLSKEKHICLKNTPGTTVSFSLAKKIELKSDKTLPPIKTEYVLVVDPNNLNRVYLGNLLLRWGYIPILCTNLQEALLYSHMTFKSIVLTSFISGVKRVLKRLKKNMVCDNYIFIHFKGDKNEELFESVIDYPIKENMFINAIGSKSFN
jgi:hypothetical protein